MDAMNELIFEISQEADGGFFAECLTESIVTQGDSWEQLRDNVREAVHAYYFDRLDKRPTSIRLHLVRDETVAVA
jgi:predicted RNase H-like HicB family nuclease